MAHHRKGECDKVKKSFKGLKGFNVLPSDANCAVGKEDYITCVNSSIVFYNKCTNKMNAQYYLSNFTSSTQVTSQPFFPTSLFMSDPWILWDPHVKRFAMVAIAITSDTNSTIYFAISKGETFCDYLNDWYKYTINLGIDGDYFADYPKLGFDGKAYYITARMFLPGPDFTDLIYGFTKREVLKGEPIVEVVNTTFDDLDFIHPLKVYDHLSPMVFVLSDTTSNPATTISFITIANFTTITGPTAFNVAPYYQPGNAPQLGGVELETIGSIFMSGSLRCGHVWISHTVGLSNNNIKVRWYDILYDGSTFKLNQYETIGLCNNVSYWMSHIDVDQCGNMGLGFSSLDSLDPNGAGIAFTGRTKNELPNLTHDIKIVKKGEGIYNYEDTSPNRWGDYSGLSYDPCEERQFWLINQYGFNTELLTPSYKTHNAMVRLSEVDICCTNKLIQIPSNNNNNPLYYSTDIHPHTLHTASTNKRAARVYL